MIIYGWNTKNIKQAPLEIYECPSCKENKSVIAVFAYYAHIFWIPLFPYKKTIQITCTNCQLQTEEKAMPPDLKGKMKLLKSSVSIPKYLFAGLGVIILILAGFVYNDIKQSNQEEVFINNPQPGDVYILKDLKEKSAYNHYLMKVNQVETDSLVVVFNAYTYNGLIDKLETADGFYDISYIIHRDKLKEFKNSGELKKVLREYTSTAGFDRILEYSEPDSLKME